MLLAMIYAKFKLRIPCDVLINPICFFIFILKCKTYKNPKYLSVFKNIQKDEFFKSQINIFKKNTLKIEPFVSDNLFITYLLN